MTENLTRSPADGGPSRGARIALVVLLALGAPAGGLVFWLARGSAWSWAGAILMAFSPLLASRLANRLSSAAEMRPAMRRLNTRIAIDLAVYFAVMFAVLALGRTGYAEGPLGYPIAIAPALPLLAIFALYGRYFREETDELQRTVVMNALVWSGALTLSEATVWGFLESFGKLPHLPMWVVPVVFFAQTGLTGPLAGRRFR